MKNKHGYGIENTHRNEMKHKYLLSYPQGEKENKNNSDVLRQDLSHMSSCSQRFLSRAFMENPKTSRRLKDYFPIILLRKNLSLQPQAHVYVTK